MPDNAEMLPPASETPSFLTRKGLIITVVLVMVGIISVLLLVFGKGLYARALLSSPTTSQGAAVSSMWAIGVGAVLLAIALTWGNLEVIRTLILSGVAGATLGWAFGMYFTPEGSPESLAFAGIKTTAVGVLSGYLLSKAQRIFDKYIDRPNSPSKEFIYASAYFAVAFLITMVAVYNLRAYKDLKVVVSQTEIDAKSVTKDGKIERLLIPAVPKNTVHFRAEARFPEDSSVTWSLDPTNIGMIQSDGTYTPPGTVSNESARVAVVATSNEDPKVSERVYLKIVPSDSQTESIKGTTDAKTPGNRRSPER